MEVKHVIGGTNLVHFFDADLQRRLQGYPKGLAVWTTVGFLNTLWFSF